MAKTKNKYYIDGVVFFRFSRKPDSEGSLIPPRAVIDIPTRIPVYYDGKKEIQVGWASARRVKNDLIASLEVESTMEDIAKARVLIGLQYPCPVMTITAIDGIAITGVDLKAILLTSAGNADASIKPLNQNGHIRAFNEVLN